MASLQELIAELGSSDFNSRALALAELVHRGKAATGVLIEAFNTTDDRIRAQVAQALSEIADDASTETLAQALDDDNEEVRAHGAQGLARINDPRAINALVHTIDDFPDALHSPYTLSTYGLIELGPKTLPVVAPLLKSTNPATRERAFLIVRTIISELPEGKNWQQLWRSLGSYDPHGATPERERAADQLLSWINSL